jgi:thiol:disulfide interchange protein DsbC
MGVSETDGTCAGHLLRTVMRAFSQPLLVLAAALFLNAPFVHANDAEQRVRALVERAHPGKKVDALRKLPNLPLYEAWIGRNIVYTDLDATLLFIGNLFEAKNLTSLTEPRKTELVRFSPGNIPPETIIKTVRGNGRDAIYVFADPNCMFCKSFETELLALTDVTIHTVLYPVLGEDSVTKARNVLCAPSPDRAWRAWMDTGTAPPAAKATCQPSFARILDFGRSNDIGITPTTIYGAGDRVVGKVPAATIGAVLKQRARS